MNPCKCGYYPDMNKCTCTEQEVKKYMEKISGPLIDRIDLCVHMNQVTYFQLEKEEQPEDSLTIKERVNRAVQIQRERYANEKFKFNSQLSGENIKKYCKLNKEEQHLMEKIYTTMDLSIRAYEKIIKVARTIADLKQHEKIQQGDIAEAVSYRPVLFKNINKNSNTNENKKINNKRGSEYKEQLEKLKDKNYIKELEKQGIKVVSVNDRDYPAKLLPYNHRPEYLFYKGRLPDRDKPVVAMVGARACSNYGRKMARALARELSENGVQIISGMARGIDTYSQIGALEGGTPTFAVLGSGVDVCYPTENIELYNDILKNGGIISEYPPGAGPIAWHFPLRNRIISGLSDKVIVVEAREKSGSLITVEWALEQGKDVMAVPGRVGEKLSDGCNCLIRAGAGIITGANDVLNDIQYSGSKNENEKKQKEKSLEKDLALLYSGLRLQPKNIYELMNETGFKYEELTGMLLKLQLMGLVEQPSENYYSKA